MPLTHSIHSSKNALIINLEQVPLKEIVKEKLAYILNQQTSEKDILRDFYSPVEQAVIELSLKKFKGNQLKSAKSLGINRNTLKKKIRAYNLNIKELLVKKEESAPMSRIFLSPLPSLDLLSACRAKLVWSDSQDKIPQEEVLKRMCQPVEQVIIERVVSFCRGNQIKASKFLGINRNTLKKKLKLNSLSVRMA